MSELKHSGIVGGDSLFLLSYWLHSPVGWIELTFSLGFSLPRTSGARNISFVIWYGIILRIWCRGAQWARVIVRWLRKGRVWNIPIVRFLVLILLFKGSLVILLLLSGLFVVSLRYLYVYRSITLANSLVEGVNEAPRRLEPERFILLLGKLGVPFSTEDISSGKIGLADICWLSASNLSFLRASRPPKIWTISCPCSSKNFYTALVASPRVSSRSGDLNVVRNVLTGPNNSCGSLSPLRGLAEQ